MAAVAYWRRALTFDGALAAAGVGCLTFARGGWPVTGALLAFFGTSSALSRIGETTKRGQPLAQAKGAERDIWQVLANGGAACVCLAVGRPSAATGAFAAAAADTWATELGLLSPSSPRLITTLRRVPAGTSGGLTPLGLAASLGGALVVAVTSAALGGGRRSANRTLLAGIGGSVVDSLLGATLQAVYVCPRCGSPTEEPIHRVCGTPAQLQTGVRWMTNDVVNLVATLTGALIAQMPNAAGHVRGGS